MKTRTMAFGTVLAVVLQASFANGASEAEYWLGEERGPYSTGTHVAVWIDDNREEAATAELNDKRRVIIQAWYPANVSAESVIAPYILFDLGMFQEYVQDWGASLSEVPTRSMLDAPILDSPSTFPVLLYSHGGNSPLFTGTAHAEFLASHGYVVVSVSHNDDAALVEFPDGSNYNPIPVPQQPPEAEAEGLSPLEAYEWAKDHVQYMHEWHVGDLIFALDQLEALNQSSSLFEGHLDLEKVGAFGWSRGGATAFQLTIDDERAKAAVNLDGYLWGRPVEYQGSSRPLLMIESTDGYFDPLKDTRADPELLELVSSIEADIWRMFRLSTADWYRAKVVGSTHTQFSDFPLANASPPPEFIPPQKARDISNALMLEFFDLYLKGKASSEYLSGGDSFPELRVITESESE